MIYTDFQPYLLPGTDAWALSPDKSMELLNYLEDIGIKQVTCVPPVKKENPENTTENLEKVFNSLKNQYNGSIELKLSARYRLDNAFEKMLDTEDLLTIDGHKELLIDVHPLLKNDSFWEVLDSIINIGYIPVVMQPERSIYWGTEDFVRLKEKGCKLMMNLYSFFGYNGDDALNYSRMLLRRDLYTYAFSGIEDNKIMHYSEYFNSNEDEWTAGLSKLGITIVCNKVNTLQ